MQLVFILTACVSWPWDKKKTVVPPPEALPPDMLVPTILCIVICWVLPLVVMFLKRKTVVAICKLEPGGKSCGPTPSTASKVSGEVKLTQMEGERCSITYHVTGLAPGEHGFHIHERADFSDGCNSAGPHYNPFGKEHGGPDDEERHVGDLGNIVANSDGVASGTIVDRLVMLTGPYSVVGRSFMVHADRDDLGRGDNSDPFTTPPVNGKCSKVTGNAGARVACGAIALVQN